MAFFAPLAEAVPPTFDGWTVTSGAINAPCPTGAISCGEPITDNGFLMRKVTMAAVPATNNPQATYYQYIVTEPGASGSPANPAFAADSLRFTNETIAQTKSAGGSISDRTRVAESRFISPTIEERMSQVSGMYHGGTYASIAGINVNFNQQVSQIDWSGATPVEILNSSIKGSGLAAYGMAFATGSAFNILLTQSVDMAGAGIQKFLKQTDTSPLAHTANPASPLLPGGTNGGDFSWTAGNRLNAVWLGQSTTASPGATQFGYTSFIKDGFGTGVLARTSLTSLANANPPVNINTYFTPGTFFNATPDIFAAPAPLQPTPWTNPAPDYVTARNDHVATPLSGTGGGGPPIALSSWTVSNGVITADPCAVGVTCGAAITGAGFYQREVTRADGSKYFQTIITDGTASGNPHTAPVYTLINPSAPFNSGGVTTTALAFAVESFVSPGSVGLSSRTQMTDVTIDNFGATGGTVYTPMAYSTILNNGWAQGSGATPVVEIKQVNADDVPAAAVPGTYQTPSFLGSFSGQQFDMVVAANGAKDYTLAAVQQGKLNGFYTRVIEGGLQTTSHALTDPLLIPGGTNGGNISWTAGDSLQATWIGSYYGDPSQPYSGGGYTELGVTAYTNLTTGARTSLGKIPLTQPATTAELYAVLNPPTPLIAPFASPAPPKVGPLFVNGGGVYVIWPAQNRAW